MNPKDLSDWKKLVLLEHKQIVDKRRAIRELGALEEHRTLEKKADGDFSKYRHIPRNIPTEVLQSNFYTDLDDDLEKDRFSEQIFVKLVEALATHQRVTNYSLSSPQASCESLMSNPPDIIIFESIAQCFLEIRSSAAELQEKYFNFVKNKTPNIDENMNRTLSGDEALRPYKKYLCRKCFMYGCLFHAHEENISLKSCERKEPHNSLQPTRKPCFNSCYKNATPENETATGSNDDTWSNSDITLLKVLMKVYPNDYCKLAHLLYKTCKEVHDQIKRMDIQPKLELKTIKKRKTQKKFMSEPDGKVCKPCSHEFSCLKNDQCDCINCGKFCNCDSDCKKRTLMSCKCKTSCKTNHCLCKYLKRECDPDLCECFPCENSSIQRAPEKKVRVAKSNIHGLGLFMEETCKRNDFIIEYRGEIISKKEADRREMCFANTTYAFTLNEEYVLDAMYYGNKSRFINFSRTPNCCCNAVLVNGDHRIGIFAARNIEAGEELTLNYLTNDPTAD
ncbi:Histone-lysine N-methyltransferase E(z) [Pseudolycoriella hygida]|uniref:Histone-lysine N-methyltransferase E(Z) n=1 Tax=Pseudolycoriella hygida TaxID=35572 RepID=A0A9Q0MYN8_9DIPT|nr:Histone-lysine N-methyltransferase E(z) [Pseudolycoriella hygida]